MDRTGNVSGSQAMSVWTERHAPNTTGATLEVEQFLASRAVPNPHHVVIAPRSKSLAVRAECDARNPTGMALKSEQLLAGRDFPDLYGGVVPRKRGQSLAIRTESHARECTLLEVQKLVAACRVPDLH